MNEIDKTNLTDQTKFILNEISKIENYFNSEIKQRNLCSKRLSKYVTAFDQIDKILIVPSATTEGVCIVSHATTVGAPVGIASAGFTIVFSLATGIIASLKEKDKYEKMKENVRNVSEKLEEKAENMRLNSVNSRTLKKLSG